MPEQLSDTDFPVSLISSDTVFDGKIWDVRRDSFEYNGKPVIREFVDHTGAVAVLALDDQDRVMLIRQYRHPIGRREWEIPAGLLDIAGEDPVLAAKRELAEEVDLQASQWDLLSDFASTPGGSNESIRVFLARDVSPTVTDFERTEEEADIEKRWVPLEDVVQAVLERRVGNSILSISILSAFVSRAGGWKSLGDPRSPWTRHPKFADRG